MRRSKAFISLLSFSDHHQSFSGISEYAILKIASVRNLMEVAMANNHWRRRFPRVVHSSNPKSLRDTKGKGQLAIIRKRPGSQLALARIKTGPPSSHSLFLRPFITKGVVDKGYLGLFTMTSKDRGTHESSDSGQTDMHSDATYCRHISPSLPILCDGNLVRKEKPPLFPVVLL